MTILASAVGQYDNVGDTVLRRGFLDHLRTLAPLRVWVGDKSDDYISGLGLQPGDVAVSDGAQWRGAVSRQLATGGGLYAFDTGETEVQAAFAKRYAKLAPLLALNRARGGMAVQLGVGVRESTRWRAPIGAVLRLCDEVSWRDDASRRIMGFGSVTPDWAFALGSPDDVLFDADRPRPKLAIAYRQGLSHAAREKPTAQWYDAVRRIAASFALEPVTVAQIRRDGPLAEEIAAELGCDAVVWPDDNHARQEERLRAVYRDSAVVLSDRLHAVVIAATEGAVPVALSAGAMDKTTRTLEGAGIARTSVDRALPDPDAAIAVVADALGRRDEIMRAVQSARVRLHGVTADLGDRMRAKGLTA
jgi:polysaccharide pyruvyl transferase WcaK-like protein